MDDRAHEFDCKSCILTRVPDGEDLPRIRNCPFFYPDEKPSPGYRFFADYSTEEWDACPLGTTPPEVHRILSIHSDRVSFEALPYPGGTGDQPRLILRYLRICQNEVNRISDARLKATLKDDDR